MVSVNRPLARSPRLFWGAWIGDQLTGHEAPWDPTAIDRFQRLAQKRISVLHFSSAFFDGTGARLLPNAFPLTPFTQLRARGLIPFFSWNSAATPVIVDEPRFSLAAVAGGAYDDYIDAWGRAAAAWGHPFFLRLNWEMNGNWFPWGAAVNGNSPDDYVAAWRHVHARLVATGATNATFVWCPNVDPAGRYVELDALYPGSAYVGWTGLDGYASDCTTAFDDLFRATYDHITQQIAPDKPMIIAETAASEVGGKAHWIAAMFQALMTMPAVRGLLWFNKLDSRRPRDLWPIESSAAATTAFAQGIAQQRFVEGAYRSLSASPIPPP